MVSFVKRPTKQDDKANLSTQTGKLTTPPSKWLTSGTEVNHPIASRIGVLMGSQKTAEFARKCGIGESLLRQYLAGSMPGADKLAQIAIANEVTLDWLATGEGDRVPGARSAHRVEQLRAGDGYADIPLYGVRAKGGNEGSNVDAEPVVSVLAFREDWIRRELRASPGDLRLLYVDGDSMEPDLRAGDIILIDHTDTTARREGIYVIRMDNALLVKILQRLPGGVIRVASRNAAYEPFTINSADLGGSADFSIIGRVVWACRRF